MKSLLLARLQGSPSTSAVNYIPVIGGASSAQATENLRQEVVPTGGVLSNFRVNTDASPGAGKNYTFTVVKNGTPSSLSCVLSDSESSESDTSNTLSVSAGDKIVISITPSGTPASLAGVSTSIQFEGSTANEGITMSTLGANSDTSGGPFYITAAGGPSGGNNATESVVYVPMPLSGTLKKLYVDLNTAPGAGKSRAYVVMVNGSPSSLTCTVSDTNTTSNDTSNSVSVSAGDLISVRETNTGVTATTQSVKIGFVIVPTRVGEFATFTTYVSESNVSTTYLGQSNSSLMAAGTETANRVIVSAMKVWSMFVKLVTSPGTGNSRAYRVRNEGSNTSLLCTVSDTNTTDSATDPDNVTSFNNATRLSISAVPTSTPDTSTHTHIGLAGTIDLMIDVYDDAWMIDGEEDYAEVAFFGDRSIYDSVSISESVSIDRTNNISIYETVYVVDSSIDTNVGTSSGVLLYGGTAGAGESNQQHAQGFVSVAEYISSVTIIGVKAGNPLDYLDCIVTDTLDGTTLGVAYLYGPSMSGTTHVFNNFTWAGPLTPGNKYFLEFERTGARDLVNYWSLFRTSTSGYSGGGSITRSSNVWGAESSTTDQKMVVGFLDSPVVRIETSIDTHDQISTSEYTNINTLFVDIFEEILINEQFDTFINLIQTEIYDEIFLDDEFPETVQTGAYGILAYEEIFIEEGYLSSYPGDVTIEVTGAISIVMWDYIYPVDNILEVGDKRNDWYKYVFGDEISVYNNGSGNFGEAYQRLVATGSSLERVDFFLSGHGDYTGNYYVQLCDSPDGSVLGTSDLVASTIIPDSNSIDLDPWNGTGEESVVQYTTFNFSTPVELTPGQTYYIGIKTDFSASHIHVHFYRLLTSGVYNDVFKPNPYPPPGGEYNMWFVDAGGMLEDINWYGEPLCANFRAHFGTSVTATTQADHNNLSTSDTINTLEATQSVITNNPNVSDSLAPSDSVSTSSIRYSSDSGMKIAGSIRNIKGNS